MCCEDKKLTDDEYDDDCYDFDIIDEEIYEIEFYEYDIEDYWAKAWDINDEGFVRSDSDYYNNREYRAYPTRYRLKDFVLTKSLRRVLNKNRDLKIVIRPFRPTEGKDDLYTAHLHARFQSEKQRYSLKNSYLYLKYSPINVMELCIFNCEKLLDASILLDGERSVVGKIDFFGYDRNTERFRYTDRPARSRSRR
jgi:hypothetical protein